MFAKNKVSESLLEAVNKVMKEATGNIKIPTATGTKVLGGRYGSAQAHRDQTKRDIDAISGPSQKDLKNTEKDIEKVEKEAEKNVKTAQKVGSVKPINKPVKEDGDCVTKPEAKDIAKKEVKGHEKKMHKESFALKLIEKHNAKYEEIEMGEEDMNEMSEKQKAKREKIVMAMKDKTDGFKKKYGKRWKDVMYATATKMAMNEDIEVDDLTEEQLNEIGDTVAGQSAMHKAIKRADTPDYVNKPGGEKRNDKVFNQVRRRRHQNKDAFNKFRDMHKEEDISFLSKLKRQIGMEESKDPNMDAGVGSEPNQAQNANTTSDPAIKKQKNIK